MDHASLNALVQMPKIDCHVHVIDPARFPYRADTKYQPHSAEIVPLAHLIRMMDLHGIAHAVIVGTNSGYGEDLSPVLDALDRGEGRFKGIAVVPNDASITELTRLKARGIAGVAINATYNGVQHYDDAADLFKRLADLGMILQLQVENDQLLHFLPAIESSSATLVIDHCGRPDPRLGLDQPGFKALLDLGRAGRASVKLSGLTKFSHQQYPWADSHPFFATLVAAFTPQSCVWASDWPFLRATERVDVSPLLMLLGQLVPDAADRQKVMWETPRRLFGFSN